MNNLKYTIFKNIISEEECIILSNWILENNLSNNFVNAIHPGTIRRTSRTHVLNKINYPDVSFSIQKRIDNILKDKFKLKSLTYCPKYNDGMYAEIGFIGDSCEAHVDPIYIKDTTTYHLNIILSDYENGKLIIENEVVELNKLDAILFPVSDLMHSTTKLTGNKFRMFWCFGFCIPNIKSNKLI